MREGRPDGLAFLGMLRDGRLPAAPIGETLAFRLAEVDRGRAVCEGRPGPFAYDLQGTVQDGWTAAILDSAMGCAVASTLPAGSGCTTTALSILYVRLVRQCCGPLRAEGVALHVGRRLVTAESRLVGAADGKLCAQGATSCLLFSLEPEHRARATPPSEAARP
jgi:uncharacterized protein (TIGR00369 family)